MQFGKPTLLSRTPQPSDADTLDAYIAGELVTRYDGPRRRTVMQDVVLFGVHVPAGYETDGASVPRHFYWLIPRFEDALPAAIAHDLHYDPPDGVRRLTRAEADRIFLDNLKRSGVLPHRRWIAWTAVRAFGRWPWSAGTRKGHRYNPGVT